MASYDIGKAEVVDWIRNNFEPKTRILDVGAGDGKWSSLLSEYSEMDACEIFPPNAEYIKSAYRETFCCDIDDLKYQSDKYDLIIFGDVIEHMDVEKAQRVLKYAEPRCRDMIIAVPWEYPQGELYGNRYERHIQSDLTPELFDERYPGYEPIFETDAYCYYHKRGLKNDQGNQSV